MTEQLWFVIQSMHKVWDRLNMDRFLGKQQAKEEAMKVRYKHYTGPHDYTIVEESPSYYILRDGCGTLRHGKKADYEPVQEWVDVTKDCALLEDGYGRYSLFHNGCAVEVANTRYKVTKNGAVTYRVEVKR